MAADYVYIVQRGETVWGQFFLTAEDAHAEAERLEFGDNYGVYRLRSN